MAGLKNWRAARQADHAQAQRMHFEALEPRLLMSADLNPVPLAEQYPAVADLQQVLQRIQALTVALNQVVDGDGTTASVSLTGPGSAQLLAQAGGFQLILTGTDATSKLSLVTSGGDGRITLSGISTDSAMGDLALANADLRGNAQFVGAVGSLTLGRVQDSTISAPSANLAIVASDVSAATPGASKIIAAGLRSLTVAGAMDADLALSGAGVAGYVMGNVKVGGAIGGGLWSVHGRASAIAAASTGPAWRLNISSTLVQFATSGDASGTMALAGLQLLQLGGSARGLTVLIGADLGDDAALGGTGANADRFAAGTLARLRVTGDVVDSRFYISVDPVNGIYADGNDQQLGTPVQRIQELIVGGQLKGSTSIIAPVFPTLVRINGASLNPAAVPNLATTPADTAAPVLTLRLRSDSGASSIDALTNDAALVAHVVEAGNGDAW